MYFSGRLRPPLELEGPRGFRRPVCGYTKKGECYGIVKEIDIKRHAEQDNLQTLQLPSVSSRVDSGRA